MLWEVRGGRAVYFKLEARSWWGSWSVRDAFSVGDCPQLPVRHPFSLMVSDVKMKIRGSLRHVREYVAKPILEQNVNTGVFLLGDFWRVHALSGWGDLRGDRPLVLSYTLL